MIYPKVNNKVGDEYERKSNIKYQNSWEKNFTELLNIANWRRKLTKLIGAKLEDIKKNNEDSKLLKATRDAKLVQFRKKTSPKLLNELMAIRKSL